MSFEIKFTPEAEETYDAVVTQLRQRWGDRFVVKFEIKVLKCLDTITTTPYIYPVTEENTGIRKCLLHKNCSMFYKVYDEAILIVCFWDNRQDPLVI
ncbi:type II toxin-antitoxin system RelE/ParE family toxin [Mucilaginibacter sp. McL0603]|uniref:type II toxin-antitoxin system RelE/ParE family toxin n=1 Tax=Mucilaginibacter sp. McL0603 TaxID=3415670 RepID=UPI003CF3568E